MTNEQNNTNMLNDELNSHLDKTKAQLNEQLDDQVDQLDGQIAERVKQAFDQVGLSAEAEERMLHNLLDYQAKAQGGAAVTENEHQVQPGQHNQAQDSYRNQAAAGRTLGMEAKVADSSRPGSASSTSTPTTRKRVIPWKVIIPAAACLLLVAGVGALVWGNIDQAGVTSPTTTEPTSPSTSYSASSTEKTAEPLAGTANTNMMEAATEEADGYYASSDMAMIMPYPGDYNTEEYSNIDEPGFIATSTRPLSTFAADVDTASYANLRRLINEGYGYANVFDEAEFYNDEEDTEIEDAEGYYEYETSFDYETMTIPKGAIRIEEMLNYFNYDYAQPTGQDLFGTTVQMSDCPWNTDTKLLVMGFATRKEVGTATAGRNLVFLIDTSGSMDEPNKMALLQDAFAELTDQLDENDRISIVTYSGYEEVVLDGASGSDARTIQRAIDRLRPEGSTNGEAGLKMAYEVAEKNFIKGGVNRIILASDGDLNVGMSSESDLHDFVEEKRDSGVFLSVLGFGAGNYKDNKMETLADAGNGNYHYIDCLEEAEKVFRQDLVANLVPLANDVKLQVEFNPAQVKGYRLIGYENRALADEDFKDDTKDAGDVGPGHQLTVAYEIVPIDSKMDIAQVDLKYGDTSTANGAAGATDNGAAGATATDSATSDEWLTCTMRYKPMQRADGDGFVVEAGDAQEQSFVVSGSDLTTSPSDDWNFAASVIEFGMVMRDSDYKGTATFDTVEDLLDGCDLSSAERKDFQRLVRKAR